jgi:hypothetical protein
MELTLRIAVLVATIVMFMIGAQLFDQNETIAAWLHVGVGALGSFLLMIE